jgi:hypothetical protein
MESLPRAEYRDLLFILRPCLSLFTRGKIEYLASEAAPELNKFIFIVSIQVERNDRDDRALWATLNDSARRDGDIDFLARNRTG